MSALQHYYDTFRSRAFSGAVSHEDPDLCRCHGHGWISSEVFTWHKCPVHFDGQTHPEYVGYEDEVPDDWEPVGEPEAECDPDDDPIPF